MTKPFEQQWNDHFPNKVPSRNLIYHYFHDFWFRIHSLPKSKRYAESKEEYNLLLGRQNQIITDCFGLNTSIYIVTGNYFYHSEAHPKYDVRKQLNYNLTPASTINLHLVAAEYYDDEDSDLYVMPLYAKTIWQPNIHNDLLIKIANDEITAFLISFEKKIIVAPYDGGIDFIIWDEKFKKQLKEKYNAWLPSNAEGL